MIKNETCFIEVREQNGYFLNNYLIVLFQISKDQSFSEAEFSIPDKALTLSIAQIVRRVQKLEELKNRLKEGSRSSWKAIICNSK